MPLLTNRRTLSIDWGYCDPAGLLRGHRCFAMFDHSTWLLFEVALGVKPYELANAYGIVGIPSVDVHATFLRPIRLGEEIEITSRVAELRRSSFIIKHSLALNGQPAVEGVETRLWAKRDDSTQRVGAIPIPPEVVARFEIA